VKETEAEERWSPLITAAGADRPHLV